MGRIFQGASGLLYSLPGTREDTPDGAEETRSKPQENLKEPGELFDGSSDDVPQTDPGGKK
jgi:hypothetical protein